MSFLSLQNHLQIIGILLIALALIHSLFPRYFDWRKQLASLSVVNREMMIVHTFFIALAVLLTGLLCITSAEELIETQLGQRLCLGFGVFWAVRLVVQFYGYSSSLWKGKRFETTIHVVFIALWTYLTVVFLYAYFR